MQIRRLEERIPSRDQRPIVEVERNQAAVNDKCGVGQRGQAEGSRILRCGSSLRGQPVVLDNFFPGRC